MRQIKTCQFWPDSVNLKFDLWSRSGPWPRSGLDALKEAEGPPTPWDLKKSWFSGILPLNYMVYLRVAAHVLSLYLWEDRGSLQHGSELTWGWYFAPFWLLCRVIFAWAHLEKILGAPLVKAIRFSHVAYLEMRLDETNTSVKVSALYLDYSGSYWQISVYVAVIDDIKINRIVKNQ